MTELIGTKVADMIVPAEDTSSYPSHYAFYGKGGFRTEATLATRNAIKSARLERGMQVYVVSEDKTYKLANTFPSVVPAPGDSTTNADWTEVTTATTFLSLTDTPSSYTGQANKVVTVNGTGSGLAFTSPTFLWLGDTPSTYSGKATYLVRVNAAANAVEFVNPATVATAVPSLQQVTTVGRATTLPIEQNVSGAAYPYIHYLDSTVGAFPLTGSLYEGVFNNCIGSYYNDYSENWASCVNFVDLSNIAISDSIIKYDKTWQATVGGDPIYVVDKNAATYKKFVSAMSTVHDHQTNLSSTPDSGAFAFNYCLAHNSEVTTPSTAAGNGYTIAYRGYSNSYCTSIGGQFNGRVNATGSPYSAYGAQFIASSLGTGPIYGTHTTVNGTTSVLTTALTGHYTVIDDSTNRNIYRIGNQLLITATQGNGTNVGGLVRIQNSANAAVNSGYFVEFDYRGGFTATNSKPGAFYYGNITDDNTITYNTDSLNAVWLRNSTSKVIPNGFKLNGSWTTAINLADAVVTNILTHPYINISSYKYTYDDTGPFVTEQDITNLSLITGLNNKTQNTISIKDRAASAALYIERDRNGLAGTNHYAIDYRVWVNGDSAMQFAFTVGTSGYCAIHNRERSSNTGLAVYNSSSLNDGYVGYFEGQPNATNGAAVIKLNNLTSTTYGTALDISGDGANWAIDQGGKAKFLTYSSTTAPSTSRLPSGFMCFWKNTTSGRLYLCCNDGGSIKFVELTV